MNILVTGGAGFIGSNFIRLILNKYSYKIINLDKLTYCGNLENLKDIESNKNYRFIQGDIQDKHIVDKLVQEVDVVINFAAESHVDRSIENADEFVKTDILGTYNILEAIKKFNKKLIQISTDEVYGSTKDSSFKETDPIKPNSPYSASKAGADLLVRSYIKTHNVSAIITRSSNNFGPYQYPEKLIPLFVTNLLEGKKVPLYGSGLNVRDWVYVIDNCEAIDFILHKGVIGEVYNIGGGNEKTNIEITKLILTGLSKDETSIQKVEDRKGHDFRYSLDCEKINKLGWKPRFKFEQAMKETIDWYKNNNLWWKKLKE